MLEDNNALNQEQVEAVEEDGFFDDYGDEETTATPSVEETENVNVEEASLDDAVPAVQEEDSNVVEESTDEQPFLTIRYDKEDVPLTREETISLSQKGKNYDRLFERYNAMSGEIERLASMNGMDVNTYLSSLNDTQYRFEVNKELRSLQEQFPDTNEQVLKQLANERVHSRLSNLERDNQFAQQEQVDANTAEIRRQLQLFKSEYPNLEPDRLDKGVYELVKSGYTLLEAYNKWARVESQKNKPAEEAKAKVNKLNSDNRARSYGNTVNVDSVESDDFMSGWNEDF